jgi:hypothetical protein
MKARFSRRPSRSIILIKWNHGWCIHELNWTKSKMRFAILCRGASPSIPPERLPGTDFIVYFTPEITACTETIPNSIYQKMDQIFQKDPTRIDFSYHISGTLWPG